MVEKDLSEQILNQETKSRGELVDVEARDSFGVHKKASIGFVDLENLTPEVCSFLSLPNSGKLAIPQKWLWFVD